MEVVDAAQTGEHTAAALKRPRGEVDSNALAAPTGPALSILQYYNIYIEYIIAC